MSPNQLVILFVSGILAVYAALILPKGFALGLIGIGCALAAMYMASTYRFERSGLILLGTAAVLCGLEFVWKINYVAGVAAAILLPIGFVELYSGQQQISKGVAIPLGFALGAATTAFCRIGKQARINKRSDL
ncbi:MAG TPA: hypothetical protein VFA65_15030 [Bryobacteraceae bacterium]|nr:hypothetical protein [Bryobacteraceae bacterium]